MKWDSQMHLNCLNKHLLHCSNKTITFKFLSHFLSLVCVFCILCTSLATEIDATSTYYQNNNLTVTGHLNYIGSSSGTPVDNLDDGSNHTIYLNREAERCLVIDPYLTNLSSNAVTGWINDGYEVQIPYSQTLAVTQPHYNTNGTTRNATAYYEVNVKDINTLLLYRSYNGSYIGYIICGGIVIIILSHLLKRVL